MLLIKITKNQKRFRAYPTHQAVQTTRTTALHCGLRYEIKREFSQIEALAETWDRLQKAGRRPEVFNSFSWARSAWKAFGTKRTIAAVAVYSEGALIGMLPLILDGCTLRFISAPLSDYNDIICEASSAPAVLSASLNALLTAPDLNWRLCRFENVPADGNLSTAIQFLPQRLGTLITIVKKTSCPTLLLRHDCQEQINALLKKDSLKRHQGKLQKKGKLTFRHIEDRDEIRNHIGTFFQQHIQRWAMAGQQSQFLDSSQRSFFEALVNELDPVRTLRFSVLELDDRPIAYHFGFEFDGKLTWYKPTFDVRLWDSGPGEVLIRKLLIYCQAAHIQEFDFTVGDEAFKYRFANYERKNLDIVFCRSKTRACAKQLTVNTCTRLKRGQPRLWAAIKAEISTAQIVCRTLQRKGLSGIVGALVRQLRTAVLAYNEVFIWVYKQPHCRATMALSPRIVDLKIRPGSLAEICDLSTNDPERFTEIYLRSCRERLKNGDQLFVATDNAQVVYSIWVSQRNSIDLSFELGTSCHIALEVTALVVIDSWTPQPHHYQAICPWLFRQLAEQLLAKFSEFYCYALNPNRPLCTDFEKAGFKLIRKLKQLRILNLFAYRWLR